MGIDPGFGSSPFGIVIIQFSDSILQVLYADEFERPRYEDMINKVSNLYESFTNIKNIFVDASSPELISSLKREVAQERDNWTYVQEKMAYCKKHRLDINRFMKVVPVPFSTEGKNMLIHTKELLEFETPIIAINPKFEKLLTSLRTAISDDLGKLDKEATSYDNTTLVVKSLICSPVFKFCMLKFNAVKVSIIGLSGKYANFYVVLSIFPFLHFSIWKMCI